MGTPFCVRYARYTRCIIRTDIYGYKYIATIPTEPVPGLVGTYGGNPDLKEIRSVKLITGLKIDRGTIQSTSGYPCSCDQIPKGPTCTAPTSTTMYCHSYPRTGKIDVYA